MVFNDWVPWTNTLRQTAESLSKHSHRVLEILGKQGSLSIDSLRTSVRNDHVSESHGKTNCTAAV